MEIVEAYDRKCPYCGKEVYDDYRYCPYCGKDLNDRTKNIMFTLDDDLEDIIYHWLAKALGIDVWLIPETIKNQVATVFLLIWPILETKVFLSNMSHAKMLEVASDIEEKIDETSIIEIALHFHIRYQDQNKYQKLYSDNRRQWRKIDRIIDKEFSKLSKNEKLVFLIYVVYRYRNNIFHGLKSLSTWNDYSEEINLCIKFMIILGNAYEEEIIAPE